MLRSTVCLIAKNEGRSILEWLAYQIVLGFDRIVVYDNDSSDETIAIVEKAALNDGRISCFRWPNERGRRPQASAYADALGKCETEWLAFFDTDEFLVVRGAGSINEYLAKMPVNASAIAVNWLVFGSGGRDHAGEGLVIERFTQCAMPRHGKNLFCKSIVKPCDVGFMRVHTASLNSGDYVNSLGEPVALDGEAKTAEICLDGAQLNHYVLKSREEFQMKRARGHASRALDDVGKMHITDDFWSNHDLNHREQTLILRSREAVLIEMERLS